MAQRRKKGATETPVMVFARREEYRLVSGRSGGARRTSARKPKKMKLNAKTTIHQASSALPDEPEGEVSGRTNRGSARQTWLLQEVDKIQFMHGSNFSAIKPFFQLTENSLLPGGLLLERGFAPSSGEYTGGGLDFRGVSWNMISGVSKESYGTAWHYACTNNSRSQEKLAFDVQRKVEKIEKFVRGATSVSISDIVALTVPLLQLRQLDDAFYKDQVAPLASRLLPTLENRDEAPTMKWLSSKLQQVHSLQVVPIDKKELDYDYKHLNTQQRIGRIAETELQIEAEWGSIGSGTFVTNKGKDLYWHSAASHFSPYNAHQLGRLARELITQAEEDS